MNTPHITAILAVTSLAFSVSVMAQGMSDNEYRTAEKSIAADYLSAQASCAEFSDNDRNICLNEARRLEKVAMTELQARHQSYNSAIYKAGEAAVKVLQM